MIKIILGLLVVIIGISYIFLEFYSSSKKIMETNTNDKFVLERHIKYKRLVKFLIGLYFIVIGIFYILNIVTGLQVFYLTMLILSLNKIVELIVNKKHQ